MTYDRIPKADAEALGKALGAELGLTGLEEEARAQNALPPEMERQLAWAKIKELIAKRTDAAAIASVIRDRLHAKYDTDEIRQSWITLTEADPMSLIRICCQLPFRADGKTDPIARTVMETYVARLTHEKYAGTYHKIVNSLRTMFHAKPDLSVFHGKPILEFLHLEEAGSIVHDEDVPRPERAERFRRLIRSWKFPELVNSEQEFQDWLRGLPESEGIVVRPVPGFESRECTVEIRTKSREEAERILKRLREG